MKPLTLVTPAEFFMEIGQDLLRVSKAGAALDLPLQRLPNGRLTDPCRNELVSQLQRFIEHQSWQPRARVFCAVGARGVSLRRLSLPPAPKEEFQRVLMLQIESEFPLPPDQLAWGSLPVSSGRPSAGSNGNHDCLVAAVKKETLEDYANVLKQCGAIPVFTLAALARSYLCPQPPGSYAVLQIEKTYSEMMVIENGVPTSIRVLPWGSSALAEPVGNGRDTSSVGMPAPQTATFGGSGAPEKVDPLEGSAAALARLIKGQPFGRLVFVLATKEFRPSQEFAARLSAALGNATECKVIDLSEGNTASPAILGLHRALERQPGTLPLILQAKPTKTKFPTSSQASLRWAAAALGLVLAALLLPYGEALVLKSHLAHKLEAIKTDQGRLKIMDRELDFLQYLKENEPPYLDALLCLAKAAPPGTRFDSISMNRRGEVSMRGALHDGQQVADLRSKLIDSGFFAHVAVEEQTPSPDRQKVSVRLSAQWKPTETRSAPAIEAVQKSPGPGNNASPGTTGPPLAANPGPLSRTPVPNRPPN